MANICETVYRIPWNGQLSSNDTSESIHHLPRQVMVKYYDKRQFLYPNSILNVSELKRDSGGIKRILSYEKPELTDQSEQSQDHDDRNKKKTMKKLMMITKTETIMKKKTKSSLCIALLLTASKK